MDKIVRPVPKTTTMSFSDLSPKRQRRIIMYEKECTSSVEEFVKENNFSSDINKIYFSLRNRESKVKNQILSTVEKNTVELEKLYNSRGIQTVYEENQGNHFQDADLRMAKGIKWILE